MDIFKLTALELSALIREGKFTCLEIVKKVIDKVEEDNKKLNFLITLNKDYALARAEEVDIKIKNGDLISPLAGVPILVKDNICTKGIKTTAGSAMLSNFVPPYNATVIEKLEDAGVIIVGKANMDEFAMGSTGETSYFGAIKNPCDVERVAGGSSSGSAAAVACGSVFAAIGSDTGGSVRQPASFCGVVGFKPTYGTVSRYGLLAYASSLDQIGPICKSVTDAEAFLKVMSGKDERDGTSLDFIFNDSQRSVFCDLKGVKIAIPKLAYSDSVEPEIIESLENTKNILVKLGATVDVIDIDILKYSVAAYYIIATAEASSNLSRYDGVKYGYSAENAESLSDLYSKSRSEGFGFEVKKRILLGTFALSSGYFDAYYNKSLKVKKLICEAMDEVFSNYDAVLMPTAPTTAPLIGDTLDDHLKMYLSDIFTVTANLCGLPSVSIPVGFDNCGLPIGMQLMGNRLCDERLLSMADGLFKKISDSAEVSTV